MLIDVLFVLTSAWMHNLTTVGAVVFGACISFAIYLTWGNEE